MPRCDKDNSSYYVVKKLQNDYLADKKKEIQQLSLSQLTQLLIEKRCSLRIETSLTPWKVDAFSWL